MKNRILLSLYLLLMLLLSTGTDTEAVSREPGAPSQNGLSREEEARRYFTDLKVITHEGQELRFYTDLLKGKTILISFFYTNCPTAPASLITLFKLQKLLGPRLGFDIFLLSISVDPERDDLKAVQEFAGKYNPQKGWLFLTGKKEHLDIINKRLGNRSSAPEAHLQVFLLGNLNTGHWMRLPESAHAFSVSEGLRTLASGK